MEKKTLAERITQLIYDYDVYNYLDNYGDDMEAGADEVRECLRYPDETQKLIDKIEEIRFDSDDIDTQTEAGDIIDELTLERDRELYTALMDDDLRKETGNETAMNCTFREFLSVYQEKHREKYGTYLEI